MQADSHGPRAHRPSPFRLTTEELDLALQAACAGDRRALGLVLTALRPALLGIAARHLGRGSDREAEDVFQEAALLAARHVRSLRVRDVAGFVAWFRCVAGRLVVHARRRRCESGVGLQTFAAAPCTRDSPRELSRASLDTLGSLERLALVLRRVHELDWERVCWLLERSSVEAVRCLEGRARRRLRRRAPDQSSPTCTPNQNASA